MSFGKKGISMLVVLILLFVFSSCSSTQNLSESDNSSSRSSRRIYDEETGAVIMDHDDLVILRGCNVSSSSLTLPQNIQNHIINYVGDHSFNDCNELVELTIPDGYEYIGHFAIMDCPNLEKIYIGKDLFDISSYVFTGCPKLKEIIVSTENAHLYSKDGCVIERESGKLVATNGNLPDGIKEIGFGIFSENKNISEIKVPYGVERIYGMAFDGSTLSSVTLPDSLKTLDIAAFSNCPELKEIYIPASVETIGARAFYDTNGIVINCEAESKPAGWDEKWLDNCTNYTINWGVTREG